MYAVIKTGGKQYRVKAGDLLVVEKLDGEPGAEVSFGEVLMLGDGGEVTLGAPTVAGAAVTATLIETRKGEKVKIFKKIRRQGYRRTKGHRQLESVLRVTAVGLNGKEDKWDGTVDLTTKAVLNARARNLKIAGLTTGSALAAFLTTGLASTLAGLALAAGASVVRPAIFRLRARALSTALVVRSTVPSHLADLPSPDRPVTRSTLSSWRWPWVRR